MRGFDSRYPLQISYCALIFLKSGFRVQAVHPMFWVDYAN